MTKRLREETESSGSEVDGSHDEYLSPQSPSSDLGGHTPKYMSVEEPIQNSIMQCVLPPHKPLGFATLQDYETHYQLSHTNRCADCGKNLPTAHFLDLHIAENHDPMLASKRDAGEKTYACFVEDCDKVCLDWRKRRSHLVDKHGFPRNYDFFVVDSGVDGRQSMLRPGVDAAGHRKSSRERSKPDASATENAHDNPSARGQDSKDESDKTAFRPQQANQEDVAVVNESMAASIDELSNTMAALKMVPRSVTFGRKKGRAGFAKR